MRKTLRPKNKCKECGDTWFPRGRNLSNHCPSCGSANVKVQKEGIISALIILFIIALGSSSGEKGKQETSPADIEIAHAIDPSPLKLVETSMPESQEEIHFHPTDSSPESDLESNHSLSEYRIKYSQWVESENRIRDVYTQRMNVEEEYAGQMESNRNDYLHFVSDKNINCGELGTNISSNINADITRIYLTEEEAKLIECHTQWNIKKFDSMTAS